MAIIIRRLRLSDAVERFDCGDARLNDYLLKHAWNNQQKSSIGVTYVAVDEGAPNTVIGYFTLASSSLEPGALPKKQVRGLPRYDLPMLLLARLAVDRRFSGRGLGGAMISKALEIGLSVAEQVGCRCVIVDAYPTAVNWYKRYGFIPIEGGERGGPVRMYLDIRTLRAARILHEARE